MLKSEELLNKLEEVKAEIKALQEENKIEDAHSRLHEIEDLKKEIEVAKALENEEIKGIENKSGGRDDVKIANVKGAMGLLNRVSNEDRESFLNAVKGVTQGENETVVPTSIQEVIFARVGEISPLFNRVKKLYLTGNVNIPKEGNGVTVGFVEEEGAVPESKPTLGNVILKGYMYSALVKVSKKIVANAGIDIVAYVIEEISRGVAKFIEKQIAAGTSEKTKGLVSITNVMETATASKITCDDLIDLQLMVDASVDGVWVMNTNMLKGLRKLKDADGRYLLTGSLVEGFKYQILGCGVIVSKDLDDSTIIYGDLNGFTVKIAQDTKMEILGERFADTLQNGYLVYGEMDCAPVDESALAKLTVKAA